MMNAELGASIQHSSFIIPHSLMGDWLKLTEEDIEQAQQMTRAVPVLTEALVIHTADLPATAPSNIQTSADLGKLPSFLV